MALPQQTHKLFHVDNTFVNFLFLGGNSVMLAWRIRPPVARLFA
jgi:hypothetical protein